MTQEEFKELEYQSGLDPRTLKAAGIDVGEGGLQSYRDALANRYEREAAARIRAARALRGVLAFPSVPGVLQTVIQNALMNNWTAKPDPVDDGTIARLQ